MERTGGGEDAGQHFFSMLCPHWEQLEKRVFKCYSSFLKQYSVVIMSLVWFSSLRLNRCPLLGLSDSMPWALWDTSVRGFILQKADNFSEEKECSLLLFELWRGICMQTFFYNLFIFLQITQCQLFLLIGYFTSEWKCPFTLMEEGLFHSRATAFFFSSSFFLQRLGQMCNCHNHTSWTARD